MRSDGFRPFMSVAVAGAFSLTMLATGGRTLYTARPAPGERPRDNAVARTRLPSRPQEASAARTQSPDALEVHTDAIQLLGDYLGLDMTPAGFQEMATKHLRRLLAPDSRVALPDVGEKDDASGIAERFAAHWPLEPLIGGVSGKRLASAIEAARPATTGDMVSDSVAFLHEYFWGDYEVLRARVVKRKLDTRKLEFSSSRCRTPSIPTADGCSIRCSMRCNARRGKAS